MALKALLNSLEGLTDEIKAHYTKTGDGNFRLDVTPTGGLALEDVKGLTAQLATVMIDQAATKAIADRKGSIDLLLPHVRASSRLKTDGDGEFYIEVVDAAGIPQIGNAKGDPMTIDQFVESMRQSDVFVRAFDGSGASVGGSPPNAGTNRRAGGKTVHVGDQAVLNSNLEAIARGDVTVIK